MEYAWKIQIMQKFKNIMGLLFYLLIFFHLGIILPDKISTGFFLSSNILCVLLYQIFDSLSSSGCLKDL